MYKLNTGKQAETKDDKYIKYSYTSNKSLRVILSTNSLYDGIDDFAVEVAVYPAKVRLS